MDLLATDAWGRWAAARFEGRTVRKITRKKPGLYEFTLSGRKEEPYWYLSFQPPEPIVCLSNTRFDLENEASPAIDPGLRQVIEGATVKSVRSAYPERRLIFSLRPAIPRLVPDPLRLLIDTRPPGGAVLIDGAGKKRWQTGSVSPEEAEEVKAPENLPQSTVAEALEGKTPSQAVADLPRALFGFLPWVVRFALSGLPPDRIMTPEAALDAAGRLITFLKNLRETGGGWEIKKIQPRDPDSYSRVAGTVEGGKDLNHLLAESLGENLKTAAKASLRRKLARELRKEIKKTARTLAAVGKEIPEEEEINAHRTRGELILSYLHLIPAGKNEVRLPSFEDSEKTVSVDLDPSLSLQANAAAYFSRSKKGLRARKEKIGRQEDLSHRLTLLSSFSEAAASCRGLEDLRDLDGKIRSLIPDKKSKRTSASRALPVMIVYLPAGNLVMVGKNARQNDLIYRFLSRGDDLWFHVKNMAGSHVILRPIGKKTPSPEAFQTAAALAARFSKGQRAGKVEIITTRRRYLKKPPGGSPGTVLFRNESSTVVDLSDPKIQTLLEGVGIHAS